MLYTPVRLVLLYAIHTCKTKWARNGGVYATGGASLFEGVFLMQFMYLIYVPRTYSHVRWQLLKVSQVFVVVLV